MAVRRSFVSIGCDAMSDGRLIFGLRYNRTNPLRQCTSFKRIDSGALQRANMMPWFWQRSRGLSIGTRSRRCSVGMMKSAREEQEAISEPSAQYDSVMSPFLDAKVTMLLNISHKAPESCCFPSRKLPSKHPMRKVAMDSFVASRRWRLERSVAVRTPATPCESS
ncbi:hypothetical protein NEOLEDRAFT_1132707 [Neolentinus lepideus HHB14362 ss-1]|uniref:Uncharacterized protein n=1 Tax=Neolentinus lepideus HHB14362 ss-1 TaxID=1314782 RepID=A0A165T4Q4_9AGAM|nr:hypothetical protein NEOLEDRAFT_1132707 [Neolentinus lepideus HHB14362 ss-1]